MARIGVFTRPGRDGPVLYYFYKGCRFRIWHERPERLRRNFVSIREGLVKGLDWSKAVHIWSRSAVVPSPEGAKSFEMEPGDWLRFGFQNGWSEVEKTPSPVTTIFNVSLRWGVKVALKGDWAVPVTSIKMSQKLKHQV
ncbi:hypothetical protein BJ878DRAFT_476435 [Calycina marina]|uniref:Uncharacterized protein n=1 Tax=Calycina marina TaxID=1763456 RepID=A0A9P7ZBJ6_9HELO|nr:hypothetical protein BJ878DRAFT_476435 [Calycina marina]